MLINLTTASWTLAAQIFECGASCDDFAQRPLRGDHNLLFYDGDYGVIDTSTNILYISGQSTQSLVASLYAVDLTTRVTSRVAPIFPQFPSLVSVYPNSTIFITTNGGSILEGYTKKYVKPFNGSSIVAAAKLSNSEFALLCSKGSNLFLEIFAVNTTLHTMNSTSITQLELSVSTLNAAFCLAPYGNQLFAIFTDNTLQSTIVGFDMTTGAMLSQTLLPFAASQNALRCSQIGSSLLLWQMNVPNSLVVLLSLAQNGSLAAPVIIPPFQYPYSAAAVGDKFVISSCAWPVRSAEQASVEECALTWLATDGNRTDTYLPGMPYVLSSSAISGDNLWLISDLLSPQRSVMDIVKLNANFNLEMAYTSILPFGSITIGAYFSHSLIVSAVVLVNGTIGIVTLNTTAYTHSSLLLTLPDDFPTFGIDVPPTLFTDDTALYIVAFEEGLGVIRVPVLNPSNYSTMVLPNFDEPFLEPIYGDQGTPPHYPIRSIYTSLIAVLSILNTILVALECDSATDEDNLFLSIRGSLWVVGKANLTLINFASPRDSWCAMLCTVYVPAQQQIIILDAEYNGSVSICQDPCVLRTSVFSFPSLRRQGEPQVYKQAIPPSAYLYRNAGHHFVNNNFYCPVSSGEVFKLALNGTLTARYTVGGTLNPALFSSSVTHNDSLYVTQSTCVWTAYLDCGAGFFRLNGVCLPCLPGSINPLQDTTSCTPCPVNTEPDLERVTCRCAPGYYTANTSRPCAPCPEGGVCSGQNSLIAQDGWWRPAYNSSDLYNCPLNGACVQDTCATGCEGPACAVCSQGYGLWDDKCRECPPRGEVIPLWTLFGVLYLAFLLLLLVFGGRWNATMPTVKAVIAVYQVFTSVPTYPMPAAIGNIFTRILSIAQLVLFNIVPVMSVDCLVGMHVSVPLMTIVYGAAPLVLVLLVGIAFWILSKWRALRQAALKSDIFHEQSATEARLAEYERNGSIFRVSAFLVLLIYPTLCAALVRFFVCRTIGGTRYLTEDYTVVCNSDEWYSLLPGIAILGVLYPLFAPIGVFLLLRFKRQQWDLTFLHGAYKEEVHIGFVAIISNDLLLQYTSCCNLYPMSHLHTAQFYWWDSLELTRKLLLFVQTAVWNGGEPTVALAISVCAMALQLQMQPFKKRFDQHVQTLGLLGVVLFYLWLSAGTRDVRNGLAYATFAFVIAYTLVGLLRVLVAIGKWVISRISSGGATAHVTPSSGEEDLLIPRAKPAPRS